MIKITVPTIEDAIASLESQADQNRDTADELAQTDKIVHKGRVARRQEIRYYRGRQEAFRSAARLLRESFVDGAS